MNEIEKVKFVIADVRAAPLWVAPVIKNLGKTLASSGKTGRVSGL
jgi:hypothetical protein